MHPSPFHGVSQAIPTEDTPYSRRILLNLDRDNALVPEIWAFEIANSIFVSFKRKRTTQTQIDEYVKLLKELPIRVESHSLWMNVALESRARRWNLSAYDAAYLDLALRRNVPLATADDALKLAATAQGVHVLA